MKKLSLLACLLISACASHPDNIKAAYVSPVPFDSYSCQKIQAESQRVSARAIALQKQLKSTADTDTAQMFVGLVLFWPALFFLEFGDGPEAQEFARLKGEKETLEKASVSKQCGIEFQTVATDGKNPAGATAVEPPVTADGTWELSLKASSDLGSWSRSFQGTIVISDGKYKGQIQDREGDLSIDLVLVGVDTRISGYFETYMASILGSGDQEFETVIPKLSTDVTRKVQIFNSAEGVTSGTLVLSKAQ